MQRVFSLEMKEIQGNPASSTFRNAPRAEDSHSSLSSTVAPSSRADATVDGQQCVSAVEYSSQQPWPAGPSPDGIGLGLPTVQGFFVEGPLPPVYDEVNIPIHVMDEETATTITALDSSDSGLGSKQSRDLADNLGIPHVLPTPPKTVPIYVSAMIHPQVTMPSVEAEPSVVRNYPVGQNGVDSKAFENYFVTDELEPSKGPRIFDVSQYPNPAVPTPPAEMCYTNPHIVSDLPDNHALYKLLAEHQPLQEFQSCLAYYPSFPLRPSPARMGPTAKVPTERSGVHRSRKGIARSRRVSYNAPTQSRSYNAPSATSRKDVPSTFKSERSADGRADYISEVERKRRLNTLAARRSRRRKEEEIDALEEQEEELSAATEMWMDRALALERDASLKGIAFPVRWPEPL